MLTAVVLCGCSTPYQLENDYIYRQDWGRGDVKWKLVWEDEFEEEDLDTLKWSKVPPAGSSFGRYMSTDEDCFRLYDGKLFLRGIINKTETKDQRRYHTGGIQSKGKFAFQYGRVEVRARIEKAKGAWPAIWMLSELKKYGDYPNNGEIDIMQYVNFKDHIWQSVHSHNVLRSDRATDDEFYARVPADVARYNVYALEWYPDRLEFYLNGKNTFTYKKKEGALPSEWPYDQPFHLLINQQLGGYWAGAVNSDHLPANFVIDWVRVYQ
ncbi:glycoside hydrolase family 16 protein [Robertkochia aurantiaca]|uniref:glycoside hydrolase family 16 protein n=1 Tax=Robertkochia aurantiaca TaxID=2873700 RepID=UPI001CCC5C42|nr:glycoside hydrolase family 16 protein [Robertkochia sp. 3YJGBD-33]